MLLLVVNCYMLVYFSYGQLLLVVWSDSVAHELVLCFNHLHMAYYCMWLAHANKAGSFPTMTCLLRSHEQLCADTNISRTVPEDIVGVNGFFHARQDSYASARDLRR